MTDAVRPYVFDQGAGRRRLPTWLRTVFVAADGTVFAPAELGGRLAYLFALHDGVRVVSSRRHVYVPTAWRRREYPDTAGGARSARGADASSSAGRAGTAAMTRLRFSLRILRPVGAPQAPSGEQLELFPPTTGSSPPRPGSAWEHGQGWRDPADQPTGEPARRAPRQRVT